MIRKKGCVSQNTQLSLMLQLPKKLQSLCSNRAELPSDLCAKDGVKASLIVTGSMDAVVRITDIFQT